MSKKNKTLVLVLLLAVVLLAAVPFLTLKDAEFGGSDDAGSVMVEEIHGEYEPWFTPVLEDFLGKEIPGEVESLLFCVQTGIGVGTPGRIKDLFLQEQTLRVDTADIMVVDEADMTLEFGFLEDVDAIAGKMKKKIRKSVV